MQKPRAADRIGDRRRELRGDRRADKHDRQHPRHLADDVDDRRHLAIAKSGLEHHRREAEKDDVDRAGDELREAHRADTERRRILAGQEA